MTYTDRGNKWSGRWLSSLSSESQVEAEASLIMDSGRRRTGVARGTPDQGSAFQPPRLPRGSSQDSHASGSPYDREPGGSVGKGHQQGPHPYQIDTGGSGGGKHFPPAFHSNGSPHYEVGGGSPRVPGPGEHAFPGLCGSTTPRSNGASANTYAGGSLTPSSLPDKSALEERARTKISQVQNVAAAVESGLRKQRDHLQAQLDKAAEREAMLEARVGELEEKLLLEDSVWSELALDPRMTPEAMALQLRRAKEMQVWAQRAEEDERRARIAAETALKQLEHERDAAQKQLVRAHAKLGEVTDAGTAVQEIRQRLSQLAVGVPPRVNPAGAASDVSPLVSRDVLIPDAREQGRRRLEAAMQEAYQRAGVDAGASGVNQTRQQPLEPSPLGNADPSPYTPRAIETSSCMAPAAALSGQTSRSRPSFDIDETGRLLVASATKYGGFSHDVAVAGSSDSDNSDAHWSSDDPAGAGPGRRPGGVNGASAEHSAAPPGLRMGPMGAKGASSAKRHADSDGMAPGRLSVLTGEKGLQGPGSGGANAVNAGNAGNAAIPGVPPCALSTLGLQGPGSGGRGASGPPPAWWRGGVGFHGDDDISEYDNQFTAAGTITYTNENDNNSDATAPSVSDEAAGSSDDDVSRNGSSSPMGDDDPLNTKAGVEADLMRDPPPPAWGRKDHAAPRMGGPNAHSGQHVQLKRLNRDKMLPALHQTSTPPSSFGQLLCSLPEAKPVTQFPVLLDHTSSPPSSARNLTGWGQTLAIPAFPGTDGWDGGSDEEEEDFASSATHEQHHGPAAPSSTDSLIQGMPSTGYERGGPDGVRIEPKPQTSNMTDMSPWPSANSAASFQAAYAGMVGGAQDGGGDGTPLPSVSSLASSVAVGNMQANVHGVLPRPALQPMSISAMPDISPWPSTTSLADAYAPSSRQGVPPGSWGGVEWGGGNCGVATDGGPAGVGMAPMSGNHVDMSPFPSTTSLHGGGGFGRVGVDDRFGAKPAAGGRGISIAPMAGNHVDMSPFPSTTSLHRFGGGGGAGGIGGGGDDSAQVLRQAAEALSHQFGGDGRGAARSPRLEPPSPLFVQMPRQGGGEARNLLPNPQMQINMLPSPCMLCLPVPSSVPLHTTLTAT